MMYILPTGGACESCNYFLQVVAVNHIYTSYRWWLWIMYILTTGSGCELCIYFLHVVAVNHVYTSYRWWLWIMYIYFLQEVAVNHVYTSYMWWLWIMYILPTGGGCESCIYFLQVVAVNHVYTSYRWWLWIMYILPTGGGYESCIYFLQVVAVNHVYCIFPTGCDWMIYIVYFLQFVTECYIVYFLPIVAINGVHCMHATEHKYRAKRTSFIHQNAHVGHWLYTHIMYSSPVCITCLFAWHPSGHFRLEFFHYSLQISAKLSSFFQCKKNPFPITQNNNPFKPAVAFLHSCFIFGLKYDHYERTKKLFYGDN